PASKVLYPQANLIVGSAIITEGCIPAIACHGLASFGKNLSHAQLKVLIGSRYIRQVALAWDRDAWFSTDNQDPPALKAWKSINQYYPCIGLIFPESAPQPDQIIKSTFWNILERAWRGSKNGRAIWNVHSSGGEIERIA